MILFYHGTDDGRMSLAVNELTGRYRAKHGTGNLFLFDAREEEQLAQAEAALKNRSFFAEPVFVTLRNPFTEANAADVVIELIGGDAMRDDKETVVLVWQTGTEKELAKRHKGLWRTLYKQAKMVVFEPLKDRALRTWMQAFCKERGCTLSTSVASSLMAYVGEDSWALMNEMAKLCAWQGTGDIPTEAVRRLATPSTPDANVFALTDAVSGRDKRTVLRELGRQLAHGSDPHYLLAMYAFAARNLITIKDLAERGMAVQAIARTGGLHPFMVKKGLGAAKRFSMTELLEAHAWLARADQDTKNGTMDPVDALYDFVLSVL